MQDAASASELVDDAKKRFMDFALRDYELKVAYLTNHFTRMWTRFNYFVVIEAALIGGKTVFGTGEIGRIGLAFGLGLSVVWYVMGAEDRYLVQAYRGQAKAAGKLLSDLLWPEHPRVPRYFAVGDIDGVRETIKISPVSWRWEQTSTTRLAALIPLIVSAVWLVALICAWR
jgi:hypothetical protein